MDGWEDNDLVKPLGDPGKQRIAEKKIGESKNTGNCKL